MDSCILCVKAVPGASRNEIQGWLGEFLKVRIQAPPVDGKANEALCVFLADRLGLPRHTVQIAGGITARQKRVAVSGLSLAEVRARLHPVPATGSRAAGKQSGPSGA
jgi:uncharacterized protein (TIGR00251 family)